MTEYGFSGVPETRNWSDWEESPFGEAPPQHVSAVAQQSIGRPRAPVRRGFGGAMLLGGGAAAGISFALFVIFVSTLTGAGLNDMPFIGQGAYWPTALDNLKSGLRFSGLMTGSIVGMGLGASVAAFGIGLVTIK